MRAVVAQLVERLPSKEKVAGSNPVRRSIKSHRFEPSEQRERLRTRSAAPLNNIAGYEFDSTELLVYYKPIHRVALKEKVAMGISVSHLIQTLKNKANPISSTHITDAKISGAWEMLKKEFEYVCFNDDQLSDLAELITTVMRDNSIDVKDVLLRKITKEELEQNYLVTLGTIGKRDNTYDSGAVDFYVYFVRNNDLDLFIYIFV